MKLTLAKRPTGTTNKHGNYS